MRQRRVRVIPIKRSEPDVDQFVRALLALLAEGEAEAPGPAAASDAEPVASPAEGAGEGDAA